MTRTDGDRFAALRGTKALTLIGGNETNGTTDLLLRSVRHPQVSFAGSLTNVGRRTTPVYGVPTVAELDDVPGELGVGWFLTGASNTVDVLRSTTREFDAVVVFSGGYGEVGNLDGQRALANWASSTGTPLFGPQSVGFSYFEERRNFLDIMWAHEIKSGPVAVAAQSGGILTALCGALMTSGPGVRCAFSLGNEATEDVVSVARTLLLDPEVHVLALYAEQIQSPAAFLELATEAATIGKPIVLLLGGVSRRGQVMAASHTGALATPYRLIQGICEQHGVVLVDSIEGLVDSVRTLVHHKYRRFGRGRVGFFANTQGLNVILADHSDRERINFAQLTAATLQELPGGDHGNANPYDAGAGMLGRPEEFELRASPFINDPNVDIVCHQVHQYPTPDYPNHVRRLTKFNELAAEAGKPVVLGSAFGSLHDGIAVPAHVSMTAGLRELLAAVRALSQWSSGRPSPTTPNVLPSDDAHVSVLSGPPAREALAELPLSWPREWQIDPDDDIAAILDQIEYPVVLKADVPLAHRASSGAVILGISDKAEARVGVDYLMSRFGGGVAASAFVPHDDEFFLGLSRTAEGLPVLLIGSGGAELGEVTFTRVLPVDCRDAADLIYQSTGLRIDSDYAARLIEACSTIMHDSSIFAVDLNPIVQDPGGTFLVLDGKVHLTDHRGANNG